MSQITEEYIQGILDNVSSELNLKNAKYSREQFDKIAQNYFGIILPVVLLGEKDGKAETTSISLVLKLAPTDERYRISGAITKMFDTEIFVYSVVLQKYHEISLLLPLDLQYTTPNCYYVCKDYCKEQIVLQNMHDAGYNPHLHDKFLDFEHIEVSLKSLALFHAYSFITKKDDVYKDLYYTQVAKKCLPFTVETNFRFMQILEDRLKKAIDKFEGTEYVDLLRNLKNKRCTYIEDTYVSVQENCLCHGDIWKENILFKYKDNKPTSACIIDYQTARIASPAYDVLYLITTSTSSELRSKHYFQLLDIYHQTFAQTMNHVNLYLKPQQVYTKERFFSDLRTVGPACLIISNTALWLSNGLQQEGHVRSKQVLETEEELNEATNRYRSIIKGIIDDYKSYGYLNTVL